MKVILSSLKPISGNMIGALKGNELTSLRFITVVMLILLSCAWITSLPAALLLRQPVDRTSTVGTPLLEHLAEPPTWTDTLVIQLSIADVGVQQRYGYISWLQRRPQNYARRYTYAFLALADGQIHQYVIPIGIHPEWRGDVHEVELAFLQRLGIVHIAGVQLIKRPLWAFDMLLGHLLAPYLIALPPWPYLLLFTASILGGGLALLWPVSHWERRLGIFGLLVGGATGIVVILHLLSTVNLLYRAYAPLDESTATMRVPAYDAPAQINQVLVAAADQLPEGAILVEDSAPDTYLARRARYLFYPRQVVSIGPLSPTDIRQQLATRYVGFVDGQNANQEPPAGWERISAPAIVPAVWRAPHQQLPAPPHAAGRWAIIGLALGLSLVVGVGVATAGMLGARGWTRLIYAWPFGTSLFGWWMFGLSVVNIDWSWASIGLPFLLVLGLLVWRERRHGRADCASPRIPRPRPGWESFGALVILLLVVLVTIRALLLPFSDLDSWLIWALRGRGFYIDGQMAQMLRLSDNTRYPPHQSLMQTWGYIAMGGISERLVKVLFPAWYVTCPGIVWLACRKWHSGPTAIAWTLLIATTPILLDHATLGNADLPLAVGLLLGAFMLCSWIENGARSWLVGGVLALGGAAWIKFDGILLGAGLLGAAVLTRGISQYRNGRQFYPTVWAGLVALGAFLALISPWQLYAHALAVRPSLPGIGAAIENGWTLSPRGLVLWVEEIMFSHGNSTWSLLGGGYGALWIVCGGGLLTGWRRLKNDAVLWFLLLVVGGGMVCYIAFYTFIPSHFISAYFYSVDRYLLHLAPLAVLAAARSTRAGVAVSQGIRDRSHL